MSLGEYKLTLDQSSFYVVSNTNHKLFQISYNGTMECHSMSVADVRIFESLSIGTQPLTNGNGYIYYM